MKLRNKKTGEIGYLVAGVGNPHYVVTNNEWDSCGKYNSLTELSEEWEDYEEPKEHYFITEYGGVFSFNEYEGLNGVANPEDYRAIGNYFNTQEEAKKAVEKLKAWKRLKDKGFKFGGMGGLVNEIYFESNEPFNHIMVDEYAASKIEKRIYR